MTWRAAFWILAAVLPCAAGRWIEMRSPHFGIYTDAGAGTAREALERLERIHTLFRASVMESARSPVPVRVFLFSSEADFLPYRPSESAIGFYRPAPECNYIVLRLAGPDTWRAVNHEYVHMALRHSGPPLPFWFEEGLADFYSTLEAGPSGFVAGLPIAHHLRTLATKTWLSAGALTAVDRNSPYYNEPGKTSIFYAQSWALAHMLNLSASYREGMPRFAVLAGEGRYAAEAFRLAFGRTLEAALGDLSRYVAWGRLPSVKLGPASEGTIRLSAPRELGSSDAALLKAQLLSDVGNVTASEAEYLRITRENPGNPEAEAGLAIVALSRRDLEQARSHFARAIELGSLQARTYYEYALLLRETGAGRETVTAALGRAVKMDPDFADAQFLLGTFLAADENHAAAVEHLSKAASLLPRQAPFWHALALSYHRLGRDDEAARAARRALQCAVTEQETVMAHAALRLARTPPQTATPRRPEVFTPESWKPRRGDRRVSGTLQRIDCLGEAARFHIRSADSDVALLALKPHDIEIRNSGGTSFEFRCGPQKLLPVVVEYVVRPDRNLSTSGDIVFIEFK